MGVYDVLRQVVKALQHNLAVTVSPQSATLTTQQADLLGVSRPTVVKLLEARKLAFEQVNSHRRILLRDLLTYRERRRAEQYAALDATAVPVAEEDDLHTVLRDLRDARQEAARRRDATVSP